MSSSRAGPYHDSVPNAEWAHGLYLMYDKWAREYLGAIEILENLLRFEQMPNTLGSID